MKRLFDIIASLACLILFSPIIAVVSALIRMTGKGHVFETHKRIGRGVKPFNLYKFRTEAWNAPRKASSAVEGGADLTRLGRFLKKTSIDELPSLFNVLLGDMSIAGPRAEARKHVSKYRKDYREILKIRPGIIDMAAILLADEEKPLKGKRNTEEYYIHVLLPEKIKLAKEYVKKASLAYDLKILLITAFRLFYRRDLILGIINKFTAYRRPIVIGIHLGIFALANYLAFFVRFDARIEHHQFAMFLRYLPFLIILRTIFLFAFSLDKGLWKYVSVGDLLRIATATTFGSALFLVIVRHFFDDISYPRSIYVIDWFLNVFFLGGIRLFRRLHEKTSGNYGAKKRIIIIGAGDASEMLLRDIQQSPSYPYEIIGLIDANPAKKGLKIRDINILGTRKELDSIVAKEEPDEFLIAIPSASPLKLQSIVKNLRQFGLPIKILPGLWDIVGGKDLLSTIKALEPEDILFRAPVCDSKEELSGFFGGKRVMVTGAGGSIGSELSRQIASFGPERLILFERHEESLYKIDLELRTPAGLKTPYVTSVIGDIIDKKRVAEVIKKFRPEVIFHTAAYKHVPLMEDNPVEAFRTNVTGTKIVAETAKNFGVKKFILISTDKAVNPVNVMGKTKKIAEEIIRGISMNPSGTKHIIVRFGNVLESSGSVVPLFKDQIKRGGPVTITHPDTTRYFMTIPEAVNLVLYAAFIGAGGEVFVLDMGKPIKILDLAKRMITLYGYRPGIDIDISFIGLRPGEKLYEDLFNENETTQSTAHPKINKAISNVQTDQTILDVVNSMGFSREVNMEDIEV
ncbi:MAG: polysaccharide biosynthesis protein [Thermodesulfovibrionales bacterium]|nr:polysaccharide biosynthesis protein [Thermodesulfovibrionales bacterium]